MPDPKRPARRPGLSSVLDGIISGTPAPVSARRAPAATPTDLDDLAAADRAPVHAPGHTPAARKGRETLYLSDELRERMRDAVVQLSGPPLFLTLASFAESAVTREVERLEREHNKGKPFPKRLADVRKGRPIR